MYKIYDLEDVFGEDLILVENGDDYKKYKLVNESGCGFMTIYNVFKGIQLVYNNFNSFSCYTEAGFNENTISINHCNKGRYECKIDDQYVYMGEGDLAIFRFQNTVKTSSFPLGKYEGYTLLIDIGSITDLVSKVLNGVTININHLLNRLSLCNDYFVMRANESIQHIFNELYHVKPSVRRGYFKLKALEVVLFLASDEESLSVSNRKYYTHHQVEKIKNAKKSLVCDLTKHVTIEELSTKYGISKTLLKDSFKDVYGESPYTYLKKYRIHTASIMLKDSKKTISEIAGLVGYQNASKFSKAFKDVKGVTPSEYRKN